MRYFFDTEFIENGHTIDLISIGIVCEDERTYYAINQDCDFSKADDWVAKNVLEPIGLSKSGWTETPDMMSPRIKEQYLACKSKEEIKHEVAWFIKSPEIEIDGKYIEQNVYDFELKNAPEFWADYAAYDWVVFCQLFGKMIDLPKSFPMYCNDIQQEFTRRKERIEISNSWEHNALSDAICVKQMWQILNE